MDWDALDEYTRFLDEFEEEDETAPVVSALLVIACELHQIDYKLHKLCKQSENSGYRRR